MRGVVLKLIMQPVRYVRNTSYNKLRLGGKTDDSI